MAFLNLINRGGGEVGDHTFRSASPSQPPTLKKPIGLILQSQSLPPSPCFPPVIQNVEEYQLSVILNIVYFKIVQSNFCQGSNALLKIQLGSYLFSTN